MKISVITVSYNAASTIEETIRSVLAQTYDDMEYIIVDGKSSDATMEIVGRYADRIDKIISEPDGGIYDAMNKGLRMASGDYVNFMNAGDTFSSATVLEEVAGQADSSADVIYGDSTMVDYDGRKIPSPADNSVEMLRKRPVYRHNASFVSAALHRKIPFATERKKEFKYALDYNQIFNMWHSGAKFRKVNVDVVTWDKRGTSDRNVQNIKLMFAISHQFRRPTLKEKLTYVFDYVKAIRRDLVRKMHN